MALLLPFYSFSQASAVMRHTFRFGVQMAGERAPEKSMKLLMEYTKE
jgi:hypothetical protein